MHGISHQELPLKQHTVGKAALLAMGTPVLQAWVVMGLIFGPDTCLSPEMPSSRGNLLKIDLPSTFGHLSFFSFILCPQLSLPPCLPAFPLLKALCWCPHDLFSLLNSFRRLIYITQHSRKWSRVGELHKLITARRMSREASGPISFLHGTGKRGITFSRRDPRPSAVKW